MDWQKNRITIGLVVLVAAVGFAIWAVQSRTGDTPSRSSEGISGFPDIESDDVTVLEITRPEDSGTAVRLEKVEGTWRVTAPVEAAADQAAVTTALEKLDSLTVGGVAATSSEYHERLEVDPSHGVHVLARDAAGEVLANLWIGAFRSGSTMVRLEGDEHVALVRDSIKFAFNKELRDWRDRSVLDLEADAITEAAWVGPHGTFRFERPLVAREAPAEGAAEGAPPATELGDWQPVEVSFVPAPVDGGAPTGARTSIENYAASKVRSAVSSLANLRASDFAAADVDAAAAGIGPDAPRVILTVREAGTATPHTLRLGNEANAERHDFYAQHEGDPTIYVVSRFLGERIHAEASLFAQTPAGEAPAAAPEGMPGMPGMPSPDSPEQAAMMEQIRRQLEAQGIHAGGGPPPH